MIRFLEKPLLGAVFLLVFLFCFFPVCNFDVGLHIKTGEYIFDHFSVPKYNVFSCANQGFRTVNDKWLFQAITYLLYNVFGFHGLCFFRFLILLVTLILIASIEFKRKYLLSTLIPVTAGLLLSTERLFFRPDLASLFFLCLYFFLIMKERQSGKKIFIYLIPLIHIIWANIHGYFFMGLLFIAVFFFSDVLILLLAYIWKKKPGKTLNESLIQNAIDIDIKKSRARLKPYALVFFLSVAASFVNPNGWRGAYFPVNTLLELRGSGRILLEGIFEFSSPLDYIPYPSNAVIIFPWFVITSFVIVLLYFICQFVPRKESSSSVKSEMKLELSYIFLFALLLTTALAMRRNICQFGLLSVPFLAACLNSLSYKFETWSSLFKKRVAPVARILILVPMLFIFVDVASNRFFFRERFFKVSGSGVSKWALPEGGLSFVKKEDIKGNAFTSFGIGSYFVYGCFPDNLPFIDGNTFGYDIDFYRKFINVLNRKIHHNEIAEEYDINFFFLRFIKSQEIIIPELIKDPKWKLIYFDGITCILLKDSPENRSLIDRFEIFPEEIDDESIEEHILSMDPYVGLWGDISRFLGGIFSLNGRYPLIKLNWARFFELIGLEERAIYYYKKAVEENKDFTEAYLNLGWMHKKMGKLQIAEQYTRMGLATNPNIAKGHLNLAFILEERKNFQEAEKEYREVVRLNPAYPVGHYELGRFYLKTENSDEAKEAFLRTLKLVPTSLPALAELLNKFGTPVLDEIRTILTGQKKLNPQDSRLELSLGYVAEKEGDLPKAVEHFNAFLQENPSHGAAFFHVGVCLFHLERKEEARINLEKAISLNPSTYYVSYAKMILEEIKKYGYALD